MTIGDGVALSEKLSYVRHLEYSYHTDSLADLRTTMHALAAAISGARMPHLATLEFCWGFTDMHGHTRDRDEGGVDRAELMRPLVYAAATREAAQPLRLVLPAGDFLSRADCERMVAGVSDGRCILDDARPYASRHVMLCGR
jgi:hypothetical protein